jgi:M3 family oligoendopeptidase
MRASALLFEGYERVDLKDLTRRTRALAERLAHAGSPDEAISAVIEWNELRARVDTNKTRAHVRYQQNTADAAAKEEQSFWNDAAPALRELDDMHARSLIESPHVERIVRRFGSQLLRLKECAANMFAPEIRAALAEEARLCDRYVALTSLKELELGAQRCTLAEIGKYLGAADRDTRLGACQARAAFCTEHAEELDGILGRLISLRDQMGKTLGLSSYVPLAYKLKERIGYGEPQVIRFRDAIRREVVPLCEEICARQAGRLGLEKLMLHDELVFDGSGRPVPIVENDRVLSVLRDVSDELHPELGELMSVMLDRGLFDVELRDGKAPGGFCNFFSDLALPYVHAQLNGSDADVHVLTHECGHAFQCYCARFQPLIEYIAPTGEGAELCAMGMEVLTYPWMDRFFGDAADRYRQSRIEQAMTKLPLFALLDHFQHEIYAVPSLSAPARYELWQELEREYMPWRNYGALYPQLAKGASYELIRHLYIYPFYSIEYALAWTAAMQLHERSLEDLASTVEDYVAMCRCGGSVSFMEMLKVGSLRSPFEAETFQNVVAHARDILQL